ncbi:MAG: YihY/virulence factor BrkB family protein [Pseudomonadota bacterium]
MKANSALSRVQGIWRIAVAAYDRFEHDDGTAMAGFIAFSTFLSIFPFAIFFSALTGILIGPEDSRAVFDALVAVAPEHISKTLLPVLDEVIGRSRGGVLTLSGVGAIWVASNAVEAIRVAFDRAYEAPKPRHFIRRRLFALGFVVLASITFTVLGFLIILAPLAMRLFEDLMGLQVPFALNYLRYGVGLLGFALFLFALNRFLPSRAPKAKHVLPGIAVSTVLWLIGASLFSIYLAFAPSYTITYGAFAGVIVTLLFFYLTGAVLIFGAEVNAALLARRGDVRSQTEEVV